MGIRDVLIVGWCCGVMACQPGRGVGGGTIDDHDHLTALATVDAMGGRADSVQRGRHLRTLDQAAATGVDSARADLLGLEIPDELGRYRDVAAATADGFEDLASEHSGRVTHLVNWKWAVEEAFRFNPTKPSALVYRGGRGGTRALGGAMY